MSTPPAQPNPSLEEVINNMKANYATPEQLHSASLKDLQFIAESINKAAGSKHNKPEIKKSGRLVDVRERVAQYFGVDPTQVVPKSTTTTPAAQARTAEIDGEIRRTQWQALEHRGVDTFRKEANGQLVYLTGKSLSSISTCTKIIEGALSSFRATCTCN